MRARSLNFIFVGLVMSAIALTLGSPLLLRAAVCMGIMLVLALCSLCIARFSAKLRIPVMQISVIRGRHAETDVSLKYASVLPLGSVAYATDAGRTLKFGCFPFADNNKKLIIESPHVGVFPWGSGTLYMTDVFNLFVFTKRFDLPQAQITVLPRSFDMEAIENRSREAGEGEVRLVDDADEPSGIREWVDGDLIKRIHWKLSMKSFNPDAGTIKPYVKTYEEASRPDILIIPDLSRIDALDERAALLWDGVCEATLSVCRAVVEAVDTARLVICQNDVRELTINSKETLAAAARALATSDNESLVGFEALASEAMRRVGTTATAVFVTTRIDERVTDMLIRMHSYSGLNVAAVFVSENVTTRGSLLQTKLETSGINVKLFIPDDKGVNE